MDKKEYSIDLIENLLQNTSDDKQISTTELLKLIAEYYNNISQITADFEEFVGSFETIDENLSTFKEENKGINPVVAEKSFQSQAQLITDLLNKAKKFNKIIEDSHEMLIIDKQTTLERIKKKF